MTQLSSRLAFGLFLTLISSLFDLGIALAQIIPDNSLGTESSRTRSETIKGIESDVIEGGATRRSNLFHSFREFSIKEGRGAYFANPEAIQNIFTRVTGGNISNILGTLGVLGNANLFLINPNGIIFGPNARLDVRGAFIGSTADSLIFDNNFEFSATNPDAPPLLTVNIPIGLRFREKAADISSTANLTTPENLTLKAGNLNLSGSLAVGGDLTLEALETLTIRDTPFNPFMAVSGGKLLLQGNQSVDIYALNHPQSGVIAGKDLVLRSANAISGDAHFWSGGSFRIERLDGSLGGLVSLYDPVIRASGDVSLDSYTGTSLHILAGGYVYIPGTIQITGADNTGDILTETVTLSDGSTINIDGSLEPTVDIRAGTTAVGSPFFDTGTPTSADISIGEIYTDFVGGTGGQVFLTNQYQANTALSSTNGITVGAIDTRDDKGGGYLVIDARSGINLTGQVDVSSRNVSESDVPSYLGNGGDVKLLSQGNITTNSSILAQGLFSGNVTLNSTADVFLDNGLEINVRGGGGGNITINAQNVSLLNASKLRAGIATGLGTPEAQAGDIKINATGIIAIADDSLISNALPTATTGNAGDIEINTGSLFLNNGGQISTRTFGRGNAGAAKITASDIIFLSGVDDNGLGSSIRSRVEYKAEGNSGGIEITTGSLSLNDGALIDASTFGQGSAGSVLIQADDSVILDTGSFIFNNVESGAVGNSGGITIQSRSLFMNNSAQLISGILGEGIAGNIFIQAADFVSLVGNADPSVPRVITAIGSRIETEGKGAGGEIIIKAGSLSLSGAQISASTFGQGNAGDVIVRADNLVSLANDSAIFSTVGNKAVGNGGEINIEMETGSLSITGGSQLLNIVRGTFDGLPSGKGNAGNVIINALDSVVTIAGIDRGKIDVFSGGIASAIETGATGRAGNISITARTLSVTDGAQVRSTLDQGTTGEAGDIQIQVQSLSMSNSAQVDTFTAGLGNAGDISVRADDSVSLTGGNTAFISSVTRGGIGNGGDINLEAESLSLTNGAQLGTLVEQSSEGLPAGQGNAGNVNINVRDAVIFDGVDDGIFSGVLSSLDFEALGKGGEISIRARSLSLTNGAEITASTSGKGDAGGVFVRDADSVFLDNSSISTAVNRDAVGQGGIIDIQTQQLTLNNSQITATTSGFGDAGKITITADHLRSTDRSSIQTNTASSGKAGNIVFQLQDNLTLTDSAIEASTDPNSTGDGGSISIDPKTVTLSDGAKIGVNSQGEGDGGDIFLTAQNLNLNNRSSISATTASGEGGNITLNVTNTISQRNNSPITATAGGTGNGGNVTIKTQFLIGNDNSDITANAFSGTGGNINITADGIFRNPNSEITASSQLGIDGVIETDTPEVDPSRGLINLPQNLVDPNALISQNACRKGNTSEFIVRGRGGLPSTPEQVQSSDEVEVGLVGATEQEATTKSLSSTITTRKIIPAQGWRRNIKGEMVLVAYPTADGANRQLATPANCSSK